LEPGPQEIKGEPHKSKGTCTADSVKNWALVCIGVKKLTGMEKPY